MKLQVIGFATITVLAVAGVDYSMQARASSQGLSQLGVSGYIDTISGRYQAASVARAKKARQKQDVKTHLPEAPEGWTRSEWADANTTGLEPVNKDMNSWERRALSAIEVAPMMGGMVAADVQLATKLRRTSIWVYERDDEIIALRVIYNKHGEPRRFPGLDTMIEEANLQGALNATPYAFVQGVAFGEVRTDPAIVGPVTYRNFSASLGSDIMIAVRSQASDASVLKLMRAINYDGLNDMLDEPLQGIGKDAPKIDPADMLELAAQVISQRQAALAPEETVTSVAAVAEDEVDHAPVADEIKEKVIGVGFDTVRSMPGQKCVRVKGGSFCNGFTSE